MKVAAISLVVVGLVSFAPAQSLKAQASKFDSIISHAMMKKDMKTLEKLLKAGVTSDFVYVEDGQKQNFAQMFANMKQGIGMMKSFKVCSAHSSNIKEKGNKGSGMTTHTMIGTTTGPDKKTHVMNFVGTSTDTYVKVGGQWKMSRMEMKTTKMTMDGKPMPGMGGK